MTDWHVCFTSGRLERRVLAHEASEAPPRADECRRNENGCEAAFSAKINDEAGKAKGSSSERLPLRLNSTRRLIGNFSSRSEKKRAKKKVIAASEQCCFLDRKVFFSLSNGRKVARFFTIRLLEIEARWSWGMRTETKY